MLLYLRKISIKSLLSISSYSGVIYFYIVTNQDVPYIELPRTISENSQVFWIQNIIYIFIFVLLAALSLFITKVGLKPLDSLEVTEIKPIESVAVPTYIGLFVIAIGLGSLATNTSLLILAVLFVFWTRLEKIFYFNPVWLFFGYRFYEVKTMESNTYTFVTKDDRLKGKHTFTNLRRLNDYTYMEK